MMIDETQLALLIGKLTLQSLLKDAQIAALTQENARLKAASVQPPKPQENG